MADKQTNVSTIVRDDFFNDPFFKDWWADFDLPMRNVQFSRQISGTNESVWMWTSLEIMSVRKLLDQFLLTFWVLLVTFFCICGLTNRPTNLPKWYSFLKTFHSFSFFWHLRVCLSTFFHSVHPHDIYYLICSAQQHKILLQQNVSCFSLQIENLQIEN